MFSKNSDSVRDQPCPPVLLCSRIEKRRLLLWLLRGTGGVMASPQGVLSMQHCVSGTVLDTDDSAVTEREHSAFPHWLHSRKGYWRETSVGSVVQGGGGAVLEPGLC